MGLSGVCVVTHEAGTSYTGERFTPDVGLLEAPPMVSMPGTKVLIGYRTWLW